MRALKIQVTENLKSVEANTDLDDDDKPSLEEDRTGLLSRIDLLISGYEKLQNNDYAGARTNFAKAAEGLEEVEELIEAIGKCKRIS